jgi:hypothetical protein
MLLDLDTHECKTELMLFQTAEHNWVFWLNFPRDTLVYFQLNTHVAADFIMTELLTQELSFLDLIISLLDRFVLFNFFFFFTFFSTCTFFTLLFGAFLIITEF